MTMAVLAGVREHAEGYPVELVRDAPSGRLSIRAKNEGGNNETLVDLWDLVEWLQFGPENRRVEAGFFIPLEMELTRNGNDHSAD